MSRSIMWLMIISGAVFSFVISLTSPTVHLYFMQHVSPQVYATAGVIETGLAAIMSSAMSRESIRYKMRRIYGAILLLDVIGYAVISLISVGNTSVRFLGLAILSAITINVWLTLMMDAINGVLAGTKLTNYQTLSRSWQLWATVAGSGTAVMVTGMLTLETAIWIQCAGNALMAGCDYKGFTHITKREGKADA